MKPKYTLIIIDNETGKRFLELEVEKTSLSYFQESTYRSNGLGYHQLVSPVKVEIKAKGLFAKEIPTEEKSPNVFEVDLDDLSFHDVDGRTVILGKKECAHQWSTYLGLTFTDATCKLCGAKNK